MNSGEMSSSMDTIMEDIDSSLCSIDGIIYGTTDYSGRDGESLISGPNITSSSTSTDNRQQQQTSTAAAGGCSEDLTIVSSSSSASSSWFQKNNSSNKLSEIRIFNVDLRALSQVALCSSSNKDAEEKGSEINKKVSQVLSRSEFDPNITWASKSTDNRLQQQQISTFEKELGMPDLVEMDIVATIEFLDSQPDVEVDSGGNATSNDNGDITRCGRQLVQAEATNKESKVEKYKMITLEVLELQFGKTLQDAAKDLSVSQATLKRICRAYGISRWPQDEPLQGAEPLKGDQQCLDLSRGKEIDSDKPCDMMTVKVTYRDDIIKFKLTPSSTMVELEEEVVKRLRISLEGFSIKYKDEDDEWITVATDSDLRDCLDELRMLKSTTMRLLVTPKS